MIEFPCQVCQTPLKANDAQAGQLVRCPTCSTTLRVPVPAGAATGNTVARAYVGTVGAPSSFRGAGRRYGFNCGYCSSRLEATESMAAQEGQCPTCGNTITIPILDRYGRLIDPKTRQIINQDPHPVHPYAPPAEPAPKILPHPTAVPPILAVVFGIIGVNQISKSGTNSGGKGMAIAGIICGVIGAIITAAIYLK